MPRGAGTIGLFIGTLDRLLREYPAEGALRNEVHWVPTAGLRCTSLSFAASASES
jgi:hypothetical protein